MADLFTKQHGSVKVEDLTGTPLDYTFDDVGDFTADNVQEANKPIVRVLHRGAHFGDVFGDVQECTGSFSSTLKREDFTNASERFVDVVRRAGAFAAAISASGTASGTPMTWKLTYALTDGTTTATAVFTKVRLTASFDESGDAAVWKVSWAGYLDSVT